MWMHNIIIREKFKTHSKPYSHIHFLSPKQQPLSFLAAQKQARVRKKRYDRRRSKSRGSMCEISEIESKIENVSRDDRSHHSVSSGILPVIGARSTRKVQLRPFIISSFDPRYSIGHTGLLLIIDNVVTGFFAIDIVLTFFAAPSPFLFFRAHFASSVRPSSPPCPLLIQAENGELGPTLSHPDDFYHMVKLKLAVRKAEKQILRRRTEHFATLLICDGCHVSDLPSSS